MTIMLRKRNLTVIFENLDCENFTSQRFASIRCCLYSFETEITYLQQFLLIMYHFNAIIESKVTFPLSACLQ